MSFPDHNTLLYFYRTMVTSRAFEEKTWELRRAKMPVITGAIAVGQEAVAAGVCAWLTERDYLFSTHRGHHHDIAKGADPRKMMAELWGKATGTNKGKAGYMHIADVSKGLMGASGVVGGSMPLAVGAALSAKLAKSDRVAVVFFGDGAANQGNLHESLNLASIWKLGVVFVCENNLYSRRTRVEDVVPVKNIADRAAGYAMPGVVADGLNVFDVYEKAGEAIARARRGQGPTFLECRTYRLVPHSLTDDDSRYRTREEVEEYRKRDCIPHLRKLVLEKGLVSPEELNRVDRETKALIEEAVHFAQESPYPPQDEFYADVYVNYP
ncbi:MAG: thiamine pyrophosphate-dependent dehydrogenase E1 component subunit alpha [Chloroflexi bacterium]|nr:thiamine pyrophosphate-dependent dehydrogenase E1 component subunit alpha [Chloroflexota bacterium]